MTEGEGRNTWRTDRYSPCPRRDAGGYLAFLASVGYQLSVIEQAVADGVPYTGDAPADRFPKTSPTRTTPARRTTRARRPRRGPAARPGRPRR